MRVVAHRGNASLAPQNTLAAFEAAWRAGADCIEMDVHLTADRQVVVIHDDTVDATTDGTGAVALLSLAEIRALDAGSWFSPNFAGQRVPTLDEVVEFLVARPGIHLLLEAKGVWSSDEAALVTEPLLAAGLARRAVVQSFEVPTVAALREAAPGLRRALLLEVALPDGLDALADELDLLSVNPDAALLVADPAFVHRQHAAGREVCTWTLNEPWMWRTACDLGVDGIITNRPDRLRGWLEGSGG